MPVEPVAKRTIAFIDGQNLFYAAKYAFGHGYPNYDPAELAKSICTAKGWNLTATYFYTGIPNQQDDPFWNHFWTAKLAAMGRRGVAWRGLFFAPPALPQPGRQAYWWADFFSARGPGERN